MTAGIWYVKAGRTAVNWGTDVTGGLATVDIAKLVVDAVSEHLYLYARTGQPVSSDQVAAAQAETTVGAVPAALVPFAGLAPGGVAGLRPATTASSTIYSGAGVPTRSARAGDAYFRSDGGAGSWLYRCTGGTSWTAVA